MRALVAAFTLLSLFFSGFVVQTHIHVVASATVQPFAASDGVPASKIALSQSRDHKAPALPDDPTHCPLCQEFLVAGAYVTPAPIAIPLPVQVAFIAPLMTETVSVVQAVSHGWRGRGPPLG